MIFPLNPILGLLFVANRSPAILGPSRRINVAEEARTRGSAFLTLVRFTFVGTMMAIKRFKSILGCT